MKSFLANIELWLSAAGLAVILAVPALVADQTNYWVVAAVTAILVGLLHGLIFWLVRRRQRQTRREAIRAIQGMLNDRINNQLTVILGAISTHTSDSTESQRSLTEVQAAVREVSALLGALSEESLRKWQDHYAAVFAGRGV